MLIDKLHELNIVMASLRQILTRSGRIATRVAVSTKSSAAVIISMRSK